MSETPSPRSEIAGIQVLRAIAAFAVVVHHTMEEAGAAGRFFPDWAITWGAAGVDIFFVISGFIMLVTSFDFRSRPLTPSSFLMKRLTRIYPFYWVCLGTMCLLLSVGLLASMPRDPGFLLRSFLLLPSPHFAIGVAWTLAYEMLFYLIFTVALNTESRDRTMILVLAAITATVLGANLVMPAGEVREFLKNPIMFEFCFGLGLAWAARGRMSRLPLSIGVLAGAATGVASALIHHESTNGLTGAGRVVGWGMPAFFIVWSALSVRTVSSALGRLGAQLGNSSYALYLTHPFVMIAYAFSLKHTILRSADQTLVVPVVVVVAVCVGWVVHVGIERRLLALLSGLLKGRVGSASPTEEANPA